ncbi:MAG: zinc-ribbon domain-containing protein [Thermoanaerobaculaceae bacterium]|jgi:predicted Zn finger-like uncharacterized protein|nr:zinc-ribbon domain-containing protein [Thermoanaerobaculaceae bacterium]
MIVSCTGCGAKYQYDESRFGQATTKRLRCTKCGTIFEVHRPEPEETHDTHVGKRSKPDETTKEIEIRKATADAELANLPELAPLPPNRRYSLAVILGAAAGQIYPITKPRILLGRGAEADLQLPDSEVSRRHAVLDIRGDEAYLVDLGSSNGSFVNGVRVERATIASHQEFSLGTTTLMFIVTEAQEP